MGGPGSILDETLRKARREVRFARLCAEYGPVVEWALATPGTGIRLPAPKRRRRMVKPGGA
jgi:hypothetical protein